MIFIFIGVIAILCFLLSAAILFGVSKIFKVASVTYKQSMLVILLSGIVGALVTIVFSSLGFGVIVARILSFVGGYVIFVYLFKKYHQVSWKKSLGIYLVNIFVGILITLFIVLPIRIFLFEPFVVAGQSMSPTFNPGDYLIINKLDQSYNRGDVIVFKSIKHDAYFIERITGLPSEKIQVKDGKLLINGNQFQNPFITLPLLGDIDVTLAADEYFVLGDNIARSLDSRSFGPIKASDIVGKPIGR